MAFKEIKTEIEIDASPSEVWQVLTDFENYPHWNPFVTSVKGKVAKGEIISIMAGGMAFKPEVLTFEENKELKWLGKLLFKGLFDGEHSFKLTQMPSGKVLFQHEERFNGLLVGLFTKKLDADTKSGFIAMNERLKEIAEGR